MQNNKLPENADDQYIEVEEYVEIISTDDKRIKIIGEELGNDTGRTIFTTISKGITSPNELAKILDVSLPLVNWHINRLVEVGLIRVEELKMSSKNRPVRYYGPAKTVLVIVPPEGESEPMQIAQRSKFDIIWSKLNKSIIPLISFVSGTSVIYMLKDFLIGGAGGNGIQLADPDAIASVSGGSDIVIAVLGGAIIGAITLLSTRLVKKH
jgi:DNA-binding transcriptional ArsR family regulator